MKKNFPRWVWVVLAVMLVLAAVYGFGFSPRKAGEATLDILAYAESDAMTIIDDGNALTFCPLFSTETKALIFYPGARVDYRAYTPLMYQIAQSGVPVVVVKMPLNFAVLAPNKADEFIEGTGFLCANEISEWYLGGHSLGGAMASQYAADHLDTVTGLVLWGSYPPENVALMRSQLKVLSIYGSLDLVSSMQEVTESRTQFPITAKFYGISGANHAQFGDYGLQPGDGEALIDPSEQWRIVTDLTLSFLFGME
ncbi:MAG: alpha/beta fold hydrolase [Anaerolineae bacterium]|nr:alpha/beta fold hydrolase [Anaerolineae bacterium]